VYCHFQSSIVILKTWMLLYMPDDQKI
jgi:hypothetical protein